MSKAFTRESDDSSELPPVRRVSSSLPPGVANQITPQGMARVREELRRWIDEERLSLASQAQNPEIKSRIQRLDLRASELHRISESAVVIPPPAPPHDRVSFGATVTVATSDGEEWTYRIVGVDETDVDQGWISWLSPLAKALTNARLGERVRVRLPAGDREYLIQSIHHIA